MKKKFLPLHSQNGSDKFSGFERGEIIDIKYTTTKIRKTKA